MKQIRNGVFETNSSSTHALVICTDEEFDKWRSGKLYYTNDHQAVKKFISKDKVKSIVESCGETFNDETDLQDYDIYTFDKWGDGYEKDTDYYETKSGDKLVIRSYYGYNG